MSPLILTGKSEHVLRHIPDNTFDAIVCDPPYELDMGRISGRDWDKSGIAFDTAFWVECNRVLKPGGNLLAFGASRTYHRLAVAIEDAGFEIRDSLLAWVKSSAMAKSQKVPALLRKRGEEQLAEEFEGFGTGLKPAHEPIVLARKTPDGSIIDNIIRWGVGGLNIDSARVPTDDDRSRTPGKASKDDVINYQRGGDEKNENHPGGRFPTNVVLIHQPDCVEDGDCSPGCAAAELEHQKPGSSRYFPAFHYSGRASASERPVVNGVKHLTVKPLSVMEWALGLAAKPGMLVLDPFAGSGTTVEAAMRLGMRSVGIELTKEYAPLIDYRVARERRRQAA